MRQVPAEPTRQFPLLEKYRKDIERCVKCGSCGAVCPTLQHERDESFSARGRMALVKAMLDNRLAVSGIFKDRLAACTTCAACEASCPSSVPVTAIIQVAKEQAVAESGMGIIRSVIAGTVKRPSLFRAAAWLAPFALHYAQGQGRRSTFTVRRSGRRAIKNTERGRRGTVAFFPGCAIDHFQQDIGRSTTAVLNAIGFDVVVPLGLKCCGRPLLSLGDRRAAEELATHNAALLSGLDVDAIVIACASCGLTFKQEYPKLLPPGTKPPAVFDIHEFLVDRVAGFLVNSVRKSVTVHDPCHLGRGQGLSRTVRDLVQAIPGLTLVEMRNADRCCGFGGVMRITHRDLSDGIADAKVKNIIASGASVVATGCPGCRMQITDALKRRGSELEVVHIVQIIAQALGNRSQESEVGKK